MMMMRKKKKTNRRRLNRRTQKKTRSSGQRERGARVKGVARTTPAKAFDATQAHVNVLKMYMSFLNFFPSALPWLKFRVYNPNSSRWGEASGRLFPHKKHLTFTEKKKKRFALLCSVLGPLVIYSSIDTLSFGYNILLSERCSSRALSWLFRPSVNATLRIDFTS